MKIALLGAGLFGSSLAVELALRGCAVDLYDRADDCITGAGRWNEGKIHLGFVYGADTSFETASVMLQGAHSFLPLMKRWIDWDGVAYSSSFYYAVAHDSQLSVEKVEEHFHQVEEAMRYHYLDQISVDPVRRFEPEEKGFSSENVAALFCTPELAVDVKAVAERFRKRIASEKRISFIGGAEIKAADGENVFFEKNGDVFQEKYDVVVNGLWDGRIAIDKTAGIMQKPWCFREKLALHVQTDSIPEIKSFTVIQGPYGDVVNFGGGRFYLSWYPACLREFSQAESPIRRKLSDGDAESIKSETLKALAAYHPHVALIAEKSSNWRIEGGVIFALGNSDISDPGSKLHTRSEIGIQSKGSYYTVDPGKYSLCPYYAFTLAEELCSKPSYTAQVL